MTIQEAYRPGRRVRKAAGRRQLTLAIWVVYLIAFAALIRTVQGSLHLPILIAGVLFPWLLALATKRAIANFNLALAPGLQSLRSGDPARAERDFRAVQGRFGWPFFLRRMSTYNLAQSLLRQGKYDEALAALVDADRKGGWITIDGSLAASLSMVHALSNRMELAEEWLVEARQRYVGVATVTQFPTLQVEVIVDLRRGRFADVQRHLDENWSKIEYSMKGESLRPLRLLRAFSTTQTGDYRAKPTVASLVAPLEPTRPGEFDYLAVEWPELSQFLAASLK